MAGGNSELTERAYVHLAPFVKRVLSRYGVHAVDQTDLCHEVFLVLHRKSTDVGDAGSIEPWLAAVCRRVAANYRRKNRLTAEVLGSLYRAPADDPISPESYERLEQFEVVRSALHRIDRASADLVALHDYGGVPLTDLAELLGSDRKTLRLQLARSRRRLWSALREQPPLASHGGRTVRSAQSSNRTGLVASATSVREVIDLDARLKIGRVGNVVISVWSDALSVEGVQTLAVVMDAAHSSCHGNVVHFAVVEGVSALPSAELRGALLKLQEGFGPRVLACATTLLGSESRTAECILNSSMLLARPSCPVRFFEGIAPAATWLTENGAVLANVLRPVDQLILAAESVQQRLAQQKSGAAKESAALYEMLPSLRR